MQQRETSVVGALRLTGLVAFAASALVALAGCGQKGPLTVSTTASASASAPARVSQLAPSASQPASVPR